MGYFRHKVLLNKNVPRSRITVRPDHPKLLLHLDKEMPYFRQSPLKTTSHNELNRHTLAKNRTLFCQGVITVSQEMHRSLQIRKQAAQNRLRKLRQRACSACFVPVNQKMQINLLFTLIRAVTRQNLHKKEELPMYSNSSLCGLWVPTKEHQTRVQTFPIFPKGFQVLT